MNKVCMLLDLHIGNYNFIFSAISSLRVTLKENDKVYLIATEQTKNVYENQTFKKFMQQIKPKFNLVIFIYNESINFGQNLRKIIQLDTEYDFYFFKTTFPIIYYNNIFDFQTNKDFKDNWYILPSHDVLIVPDKNGQVVKTGQNTFASVKKEQHLENIARQPKFIEPDYFVFGKEFLSILLMINDFKQKNFANIISSSFMLKKPIEVSGQRRIKKYWNSVPGNPSYSIVPEFVFPIVENKNNEINILKFPTVVGSKYFRNSNWLTRFLSTRNSIKYIQLDGKSITGDQIIQTIGIKYDMDVNSSLYIRKFMKQMIGVYKDIKFNFYTKNAVIKNRYREIVDEQIFNKINWVDMSQYEYNSINNFFDYIQTPEPLRFDFNFYTNGYTDPDNALSDMLNIKQKFTSEDIIGKKVQSTKGDQDVVVILPISRKLCNKDAYFNKFMNMGFKNAKMLFEPINTAANNMDEFVQKANRQFQIVSKILTEELKGVKIDAEIFMNNSEEQYINKIINYRKEYKNIYLYNKNLLYTVSKNFNKNVIYRGQ